jgi:predicted DNA-binding transcriptional regulator YafY
MESMTQKHQRQMALNAALMRLVRLIGEGRYTFKALKDAISDQRPVSDRTLFRYLHDLHEIGYPIECDTKTFVYSFPSGFTPATMNLPTEATNALATLVRLAETVGPDVVSEIRDVLSTHLPQLDVGALPIAVQIDHVALDEAGRHVFALLRRAERQRQVVKFAYRDRNNHRSKRTVEPYGFIVSNGRMFLIARDRDKSATRTFAIDGISDATMQSSTFVKRTDFDVARYGANSVSGLYDGESIDAHLRFASNVAPFARRSRLAKGGRASDHPDGGLDLYVKAADRDELIRWILSFGGDAELVKPSDLRSELAERAASISSRHQEIPI